MSRLEELITELCPDGVEYKMLSELFHTRNGYTPSKTNKEFWENGTVPWFRMEDIRENGRILSRATQSVSRNAVKGDLFPADSIIVATSATIGEHALITVPSLANQRFTYLVLKDMYKASFNIKFLFYCCFKLDEYCKTSINQGNFASVDMQKFSRFRFPLPPLPVQREIVQILDNFTELTARKKQYVDYLNILIDRNRFSKPSVMKLGELFDFRNGLSKEKRFFGKGTPFIRYTDVYNNRALHKENISALVECTPSELEKLKVTRGDVLFTRTSETAEDVGWSSVMLDDIGACVFNGFTIRATPKTDRLLPEYCAYCFSTNEFRKYVTSRCAFTTRASLTGKTIAGYELVVPSIAEQQEVINVLDKLYLLCNSLSSGLPAEIKARQKQYEYYRDKLLSFKEKSA